MYSQLRYINVQDDNEEYKNLLAQLDLLYGSDNTQKHREQLQAFIDEHSVNIYRKSLEFSDESFWLE